MSAASEYSYLPTHKYIVNHDIMHCTADAVKGNYLYSGRALCITEPWDIIQLHPDLKPLWQGINNHYKKIGLRHTEQVIWHIGREELGMHIGYLPSPFYFGPNEYRYWGDNNWLEAVEYINSKNHFMDLAHQLGINVPYTECFDSLNEISADKINKEIVYPCYLKAAVSVAGVGIYRCANPDDLTNSIARFQTDVPVQIQEEIRTDIFLNLQYRVVGDTLIRMTASEQILDGYTHQGNRVPACSQPWDSVEPMALWLKEKGIKGIFAFDVAISQTERGLRVQAIECNPRFNGASYPTLIANKLNVSEWCSLTLPTDHCSIEAINMDGIEFDHKTGEGVVIVNWGTILVGKIMVMLAGSPTVQEQLKMELEKRL